MPQQIETDVLVVGLGAVGSALVHQLAKRGIRVVGVEQFTAGHAFGSRHGETCITRQFVGAGDAYVPWCGARTGSGWSSKPRPTGCAKRPACSSSRPGRAPAPARTARRHGVPDFLKSSLEVARAHGIEATGR